MVLCLDCYHEIPPLNAQVDEDGHYPFAGFGHLEVESRFDCRGVLYELTGWDLHF